MKKVLKVLLTVLALALSFLLGFEADVFRDAWLERYEEPAAPAEETPPPELRIYDGELQWSDGARWHVLTEVEALADLDPVAAAQRQAAEEAAQQTAAPDEEDATAEEDAQTPAEVFGGNRGVGSVFSGYYGGDGGGGGYYGGGGDGGGGGGGGSDGQDIAWSSDYL